MKSITTELFLFHFGNPETTASERTSWKDVFRSLLFLPLFYVVLIPDAVWKNCKVRVEVDRIIPIDFNELWVRYGSNLYENKCKFTDIVYISLKGGVSTSLPKYY